MKERNIDDLYAPIVELYERYDEGETSREEACAEAARLCLDYLGADAVLEAVAEVVGPVAELVGIAPGKWSPGYRAEVERALRERLAAGG